MVVWEEQLITELTSILRNQTVHYRVHKSPPMVHILSQINQVHTILSYLSTIHLNNFHHLHLGLPSGLFPTGFPTYTHSSSPPFALHALPISLFTSLDVLKTTDFSETAVKDCQLSV
jgi:hypothetical protein